MSLPPRDSPAAATISIRRAENMEFGSPGRLFGGINLAPSRRARRLFQHQHHTPTAGRLRPLGADFLVFSLGFASVICLIFITGDLLRTQPMSPVTITVFVLALSYCGVLVRRQRIASLDRDMSMFEDAAIVAAFGGVAAGRSEGGNRGWQQDGVTLDKETRHQLLEYFVFHPSEEKDGPPARDPASAEHGGGGVGGNPSAASPRIPAPSEAPGASFSSLPLAPIERQREGEQSQGEGGGGGGQEEGKNVVVADAESNRTAKYQQGGATPTPQHRRASVPSPSGGDGARDPGAASNMERGANSKAPAKGHSGEWSTAGACIVCFGDYSDGEELCRLPCRHLYHATCIDAWLDGANHAWCPLCKTGVVEGFENSRGTSARGEDAGLNAV